MTDLRALLVETFHEAGDQRRQSGSGYDGSWQAFADLLAPKLRANRWAAFTDDELRNLRDALGYVMGGGPELLGWVRDFSVEAEHELERRRA